MFLNVRCISLNTSLGEQLGEKECLRVTLAEFLEIRVPVLLYKPKNWKSHNSALDFYSSKIATFFFKKSKLVLLESNKVGFMYLDAV